MIKLILFDLGVVVVKIQNAPYYAYLSEVSGIPQKEVQFIVRSDTMQFERGSISFKQFINYVANDLGINKRNVSWMDYYKLMARLDNNTVEIISKLKWNYKVAFLSNVDAHRYHYSMKHFMKKIVPLFDYKFASCDLKAIKPSATIYLKVLRKLRMKPEEILFIDNDIRNIEGSRRLGINSILFTSAHELKKDLKRFKIKLNSVR